MKTLLALTILATSLMASALAQVSYGISPVSVIFSFQLIESAPGKITVPKKKLPWPYSQKVVENITNATSHEEVYALTFPGNTNVITSVAASSISQEVYGNAQFLSALAASGVLPDSTPQGWVIMATPFSASDESGTISYSGFYAQKQGMSNVDLSGYFGSVSLPVPVSYTIYDTTNYPISGISGSITHTGYYEYLGAIHMPVVLPVGSNNVTFSVDGLLSGEASDYSFLTIPKDRNSTDFVTVPQAVSLSQLAATSENTNIPSVTLVGSIWFAPSVAVKAAAPSP